MTTKQTVTKAAEPSRKLTKEEADAFMERWTASEELTKKAEEAVSKAMAQVVLEMQRLPAPSASEAGKVRRRVLSVAHEYLTALDTVVYVPVSLYEKLADADFKPAEHELDYLDWGDYAEGDHDTIAPVRAVANYCHFDLYEAAGVAWDKVEAFISIAGPAFCAPR